MPFGAKDAARFTKKAKGKPKAQRAFKHAANASLNKDGDEGKAVRIGNAAAARAARKKGKSRR
jgi:hypothetical protein